MLLAGTLDPPIAPVRPGRPLPSGPEIILDLSRLLSRALHPTPTGIDRVEMAYARTLKRMIPGQLHFGAVHPTGLYGRLSAQDVDAFLDRTEERWESIGGSETPATARRLALQHCWSLRPHEIPRARGARILLQVSPHHLQHPRLVASKLRREAARFVCMVHDIIPISHPEYARPGGPGRHKRRLRTIDLFADGILTNSNATLETLLGRTSAMSRQRPTRVAHLGVDMRAPTARPQAGIDRPYFVCVATIEPRKNHLLLLNLWRSIVDLLGADQAPRLLLVGRRGWENENVIDMLDRCPGLRDVVEELPRLPDAKLRDLLGNARAVLLPSFAEGFDMPVAEALAAGAPVIASDIPAHREVGGHVPDYIDPIDGAGWRAAVLDYSAPASIRRTAQLKRLARWRPVSWETHVQAALSVAEEVLAC